MMPDMAGTIEERDDGRFRVRTPKSHGRKTLATVDTHDEALAVLADWEERTADQPHGLTFARWGERWLDKRETDGVHRSVPRERSVWRNHVATATFFHWPLRRIERKHIVQWLEKLQEKRATKTATKRRGGRKTTRTQLEHRLSRSTCQKALALVKRCLNRAADLGHVPTNVALGVGIPKRATAERAWTFLSLAEISEVLSLPLRDEQRAIYTVAIYTGLRAGELWGLQWRDVELEGSRPHLNVERTYRDKPTKGGDPRRVPLLPEAVEALRAWKQVRPGIGVGRVFPAHGGGCHGEGFTAGWPRVVRLAKLGRRVRLHDLRHTCASHLVMGTWTRRALSLDEVRRWLGHTTLGVTLMYAHLAPDFLGDLVPEPRAPSLRVVGDDDNEDESEAR